MVALDRTDAATFVIIGACGKPDVDSGEHEGCEGDEAAALVQHRRTRLGASQSPLLAVESGRGDGTARLVTAEVATAAQLSAVVGAVVPGASAGLLPAPESAEETRPAILISVRSPSFHLPPKLARA